MSVLLRAARQHVSGLVLFGCVLLVYVATLTQWHSGDDLQWVAQVERAVVGGPVLHPSATGPVENITPGTLRPQVRYLLELPTSALAFGLARVLGVAERAVRPVQWLHALAGAAGVGLFYLALRRWLSAAWSVLLAAGLAASYAWWYYSTHLDYTIIAHGLTCAWFYLLVRYWQAHIPRERTWLALALGTVAALVTLYLLTAGVVALSGALAVALAGRADNRPIRRLAWRHLAAYGIGLAGVLLIAGVGGYAVQSGFSFSWQKFLVDAGYARATAHAVAPADLPKTLYGLAKALVTGPALSVGLPAYSWYGLTVAVVLLPVGLAAVWRQRLPPQQRPWAMVLVAWLVLHLPFGAYWEPTYIKWWTGALVPWWGLVGVLSCAVHEQPARQRLVKGGVLGIVVVLLSMNLLADFLPNAALRENEWVQLAGTLRAESGAGDLFIALDDHPLDLYLPYFAQRRVLGEGFVYLAEGQDLARTQAAIRAVVGRTLSQGGRVFVYDCAADDPAFMQRVSALLPQAGAASGLREAWRGSDGLVVCEVQDAE